MTGRSPAGPLMHEHRVIMRMIGVMQRLLASIDETRRVDPTAIDRITDFIRTYADRCHHGKEEDILFARLTNKPLTPELKTQMDDLIADHLRGRTLTGRLVAANERYRAGDADALDEIVDAAGDLVAFYPVHIEKEDHVFFKPALGCFSDAEQAQMLADFDEFERRLLHEKYEGLVASMEAGTA